MGFIIPPLVDVQPPKWVKPSFGSKVKSATPGLIVVVACLYVAVVILLPAVSVVVQAFAKGIGPFLENFESEDLRSSLRLRRLWKSQSIRARIEV
jgi:sulfate transport system permease protein